MNQTAVLLCGHGSRDPEAIGEFERGRRRVAPRLAPRAGVRFRHRLSRIRPADDPRRARRARGARRPPHPRRAGHAVRREPRQERPAVGDEQLLPPTIPAIEVRLGRDLGDRRRSCSKLRPSGSRRRRPAGREDTLLVVVGRGTNDPDANSNIAKIARMLWEGMGFGWAEAAFSGVAHPRVDAALGRAAGLGFRRIVVFPYFLFTGILVEAHLCPDRRGGGALPRDRVRSRRGYLATTRWSSTPSSTGSANLLTGDPTMNCQLCKYRARIVGYDDAVGQRRNGPPPPRARRRRSTLPIIITTHPHDHPHPHDLRAEEDAAAVRSSM